MPSLVQTIIQDATRYVLLLCTFRITFLFIAVFTAVSLLPTLCEVKC